MDITLPLPADLTCRFVVPVERIPFDIESFVPWRVSGPYRRAASTALGTPLLRVTHLKIPWKPAAAIPLTAEQRSVLHRARQHLVISSTAPPHALPASAQLARATARALARECAAPLLDPLTGNTIPSCEPHTDEPTTLRLADDWLGWDIEVHADATCPPWDPAGTGACDCLRVTTRGLRRFALPEITLDGAACAHTLCATALLRTVAHRLLADHLSFLATHPDATQRTITDHLRIDPACSAAMRSHVVSTGTTDTGNHSHAVSHAVSRPDMRGHRGTGSNPDMSRHRDTGSDPDTSRHRDTGSNPDTTSYNLNGYACDSPDGYGALPIGIEHHGAPSLGSSDYEGPPFSVRLTPCDLAPATSGRTGRLRRPKVGPAPGTDHVTCLEVSPPAGFAGSLNDWLCATRRATAGAPISITCDVSEPPPALVA